MNNYDFIESHFEWQKNMSIGWALQKMKGGCAFDRPHPLNFDGMGYFLYFQGTSTFSWPGYPTLANKELRLRQFRSCAWSWLTLPWASPFAKSLNYQPNYRKNPAKNRTR